MYVYVRVQQKERIPTVFARSRETYETSHFRLAIRERKKQKEREDFTVHIIHFALKHKYPHPTYVYLVLYYYSIFAGKKTAVCMY